MNRFRAFSIFSLVSALVLPLSALAADLPLLTPGWSLVPEACRTCACGFAGVIGIIQNLMNAGISVGIFFAVIIMAWAGLLYISTPTNPEARSKANNMLINAVVGMVIILSAWLIVDFVMKALYSGPDGQQGKFGPWNNILTGGDTCVSSTTTLPLFNGNITAEAVKNAFTTGPSTATQPNVTSSGGGGSSTCSPPATQTNACSVSNMQKSCFASRASDAATICARESANGNVAIRSGTDLLNKGKGPSYSWGLWQINLTTTKLQTSNGTLDCPKAFTNACQGQYIRNQGKIGWCDSSIKDQTLYNQCVAAAQNPTINTQAACKLYNQSGPNGGFQPWTTSATKCNVAKH